MMNIVLWILQVLLAIFFLWHGWLFVAPPAELVEAMNSSMAPMLRVFIGVAELLAAVGLILPGLTRVLPWLTALSATGLAVVTGSAAIYHLFRGETSSAVTTAVLFVIVAFVAYLRWKVKPILPRNEERLPRRESAEPQPEI
jgi:uncharacterized membrane protein YphA (DoxX/SURF4 family)